MGEVKHDGGPAFPHGYSAQANSMPGMSLREWYAGKALTGLVEMHHGIGVDPRATAIASVQFADALISALAEPLPLSKATPSLHEGERG